MFCHLEFFDLIHCDTSGNHDAHIFQEFNGAAWHNYGAMRKSMQVLQSLN